MTSFKCNGTEKSHRTLEVICHHPRFIAGLMNRLIFFNFGGYKKVFLD